MNASDWQYINSDCSDANKYYMHRCREIYTQMILDNASNDELKQCIDRLEADGRRIDGCDYDVRGDLIGLNQTVVNENIWYKETLKICQRKTVV